MRSIAILVMLLLAGAIGYSALAQQSPQSRLGSADPGSDRPVLVAQSQTPPAAPATPDAATPPVAAPAPAPSSPAVDETALRYFARQGDTARVQAEIARLRLLHPGWEPPTNLLSDEYVPDADIIRMWDLFSAGDFAGARAAIAAKQQADPAFVVSEDLLNSLALGEAELRLRNASDAKQFETVISVAANMPELLTCERVDTLWRLAEAFAGTGNTARAVDAYSYILTNCDDSAERYATLQKAIDLIERADLAPLLALERNGTDGQPEFTALRLDLARRAIAAALEDGSRPLPEDVSLFESAAQSSNVAEDLRLMGWYELSRDRADAGRRWFERAMTADPSEQSVQGLGTALLQMGDPETAEDALADYRTDSEELTALYLDAAAALLALQPRIELDNRVLGRIVDSVMAARNANAAQELGWYAYDFQQPQTALEWFTLALRWKTDLEPAAYGMVVAANALGDQVTVESIRTQWGPRSERIANFGRTTSSTAPPLPQPRPQRAATATVTPVAETRQAQPAQATSSAPQASSGGRNCTSFVPAGSLSAGAALNHGWCLMDLNRPAQAVDHFSRALQSGSEGTRSQAAYGLSLAYIRLGLADEAAIAAAAAPITNRQAIELEIAILTQKATSAYDIGDYRRALDALDMRARYAPERNDLLTLRGWSYYHLRRYREAERIFAAVAATGYGDAVAGLAAAKAALTLF
jgi:tetratricopeptide (TPR) repeat protein